MAPDMHVHGRLLADPLMHYHGMALLHGGAAQPLVMLAAFGVALAGALAVPRLRRAFHRS